MKPGMFVILISLLISVSCNREEEMDSRKIIDTPETLTGSWSWLYSSGGFAGTKLTPESTGEIRRIEFDSTDIYRLYINDVLKAEQKFTIEKGKTITSTDSVALLRINSGIPQSISFNGTDTLILFDECYDCFEHHYSRIK